MSTAATADAVTERKSAPAPEPVWVFEANLAGQHLRGSALLAAKCYGAASGRGFGRVEASYAIPTRNSEQVSLSFDVIGNYVRDFLAYARQRPGTKFRITPMGHAHPTAKSLDFAKLFAAAPANCILPCRWLELLGRYKGVRLVLLDSNALLKEAHGQKAVDQYFAINLPLWQLASPLEVMSIGNSSARAALEAYAKRHGYRHGAVKINAELYGDYAQLAREELSVCFATRLACLVDPDRTGSADQLRVISAAARAGLVIDELVMD